MKPINPVVTDEIESEQSGWTDLVDIYLPSAISTPWGSLSILRLTSWPINFEFFTPREAPEPVVNWGVSNTYRPWPLSRGSIAGVSSGTDDTFTLTGSNVSGDWSGMLSDVDWRRAQIIVRKVPTLTGSALTAFDCVVVFSGVIRSARITLQQVTISASSLLSSFKTQLPVGTFHPNCRFRFSDDMCDVPKWTAKNWVPVVAAAGGSTRQMIDVTGALTNDAATIASYGTDLVDPLANGNFTASTFLGAREPYRVRGSSAPTDYWAADFSGGGVARWGINTQGYWLIPDAQAGLANPALEPYLTIDFGVSRTPMVWRLRGVSGMGREALPKLLHLFSSTDNSNWTHVGYFQCPPIEAQLFDWHVPLATAARYWRIGMRSRWVTGGPLSPVLQRVYAYSEGSQYWRAAAIVFSGTTSTSALRGVSRTIIASYAGQLWVDRPLPAVPVAGDTFSITRGCARNFNACSEHKNWANFGGWPESLGTELAADAAGNIQPAAGGGFDNSGGRYLQ